MVERRDGPRLVLKTLETVRRRGQGLRQDLERDVAPQLGIVGAIHHPHAAGADLLENVVMSEPLP